MTIAPKIPARRLDQKITGSLVNTKTRFEREEMPAIAATEMKSLVLCVISSPDIFGLATWLALRPAYRRSLRATVAGSFENFGFTE